MASKKKITILSKLDKKAVEGAYEYRAATGSGYIDLRGKSPASIRFRNRLHRWAKKRYTKTKKAELVVLMYATTTLFKQLSKVNLLQKDADRILDKFVRKKKVGKEKQTLHQFIIDNQTAAEFASSSIESSKFDDYAQEFYEDVVQDAIAEAFKRVM